jgi:hypothetical protein
MECNVVVENGIPEWECRDGRIVPVNEMETKHIWQARQKLLQWIQRESDPDVLRDLRAWKRRFMQEIRRRKAAGGE